MPLNRALRDEKGEIYDVLAGPFMVVGLTEDSFGSLTEDQMKNYAELFHQPELFMKMGKGIMALPLPEDRIENGDKAKTAEKMKGAAEKRRKAPDHSDR